MEEALTPANVVIFATLSVDAVNPLLTYIEDAVTPASVDTPVVWSVPVVSDEVNIRGAVIPPTTESESAVTPARVETPTTARVDAADIPPET